MIEEKIYEYMRQHGMPPTRESELILARVLDSIISKLKAKRKNY